MEKVNAVLVALSKKFFDDAARKLNFDDVNLVAVVQEKSDGGSLAIGGQNVARMDFSAVKEILNREPDCLWYAEDVLKVKGRLTADGVAAENIFDIELAAQINAAWLAKLRQIEQGGADFFVTGGSCAMVGLDLNFISGEGVNLSNANQTLQESYSVAAQVFEHVAPKSIKFVIIGLSINSADDAKKFLTDNDLKAVSAALNDYCKLCADNGARPIGVILPVEPSLRKTFNANVLMHFRQAVATAEKNYRLVLIDLLDVKLEPACFQGKWHLNSMGAAAASALFNQRLYMKGVVSAEEIYGMGKNYFDVLTKNFPTDYKNLVAHIFCRMASNDFKRLTKTMPAAECKNLMAQALSGMTYEYLAKLSNMLPKDDYNAVAARVFEISAEKLRRKDKIKVGFYFMHSSFWFGDDLYNLFASDERFEPTIFVRTKSSNKVVSEERASDAKRFATHGVNVFDLDARTAGIPVQDVLFCLTPYQNLIPAAFRIINLNVTTLLVNFPYTFSVCDRGSLLGSSFIRVLWRMFFPSTILLELCQKVSKVGMPRGLYSGYPKMDVFFKKDVALDFKWKMARSDAKKIIWAPHHSITNVGPVLATFQWNYQFMYEFAKAHPEISWVVKPHSHLPVRAVSNKIFPDIDAYEEYMRKWDALPNAQVCTGAYYQEIFATSDGMIQDCASFVAEYQYVDKPMIYLTRDTQNFNDLGEAILKTAYLVDGKDLDGIAAMMQRVFIEGDDYKAAERKKVFDKLLNYPKTNGMLASEFIFKSIADEVTAPT